MAKKLSKKSGIKRVGVAKKCATPKTRTAAKRSTAKKVTAKKSTVKKVAAKPTAKRKTSQPVEAYRIVTTSGRPIMIAYEECFNSKNKIGALILTSIFCNKKIIKKIC